MRIRLTALGLLVGAALLAGSGSAVAQSFGTLRFEQYLDALRQQAGIPGLSAAIVQEGQLAWERGFGSADLERNIAATPDTPYPVGGLTGVLSAVQALQCVERGLLELDAPVNVFFPAFGEPATTLRQVLGHIMPDGRFVYDPSRYDAVAAAIKTCSGETLRGALAESLLERLGMIDSVPGHDFASWSPGTIEQFSPATIERYAAVLARLATAYKSAPRGRPTPTPFAPTTGLTGATGLITSARDLARLQSALDVGVLLQPEMLAAAWTPQVLADGRRSPYGLGWFVQVYEGQLVVWHPSVLPDAYSSLLITLPQRGVTLILLANSDGLVEPFPLTGGDISASPFARLFLRLFS